MSFPVFISKLSESDLTEERLREVLGDNLLKNRSEHIDRLARALVKKMVGGKTIPRDEVVLLSEKYRNITVRNSITPTVPLLVEQDGNMVNPPTSIVFDDKTVATGVFAMGRVYPLQRKHLDICVTNGWYFKTDDVDIACPFRVQE